MFLQPTRSECILQYEIVCRIESVIKLFKWVSLIWKDLKCVVVVRRRPSSSSSVIVVVVRRRRRRRPSVPIEFPRKYISFNFNV
jgi:hypothetical protein